MSESLISIDARRNGRAFASLTARGGGLPVGVKESRFEPGEIPLALRVQQLLPIRQLRHLAVSTAFGCHGPLHWSGLYTLQAR